jgi:hypothetical protein
MNVLRSLTLKNSEYMFFHHGSTVKESALLSSPDSVTVLLLKTTDPGMRGFEIFNGKPSGDKWSLSLTSVPPDYCVTGSSLFKGCG